MIEWLLGDENNQPYRQEQLKATATGDFFKMFVSISLSIVYILNNMLYNISVVDHAIMVKVL